MRVCGPHRGVQGHGWAFQAQAAAGTLEIMLTKERSLPGSDPVTAEVLISVIARFMSESSPWRGILRRPDSLAANTPLIFYCVSASPGRNTPPKHRSSTHPPSATLQPPTPAS
jgi:hypothetical protein